MTKIRKNIHCLAMSETGVGKTTFASTFPKPMLVWFFGSYDKANPYTVRHPGYPGEAKPKVGEILEWKNATGQRVCEYQQVERADGYVQIEYYHSNSPYQPTAYSQYLSRMSEFHKEYDRWKTVVLDDATFMELEARKYHQYSLNPSAKDGRQWYAGSKELLEEMLMMRFTSLPMNVVVLCHIDEDKDELYGEIVKNPAMPGKLSKRLAAAFGEHYRPYLLRNEQGVLQRYLQTESSNQYAAQTQIKAPNGCYPHYDALWVNWDKENAEG